MKLNIHLHVLPRPTPSMPYDLHRDKFVGREIVVGIAPGYGLNGTGIESRWGTKFSVLVQTGPGAHPAFYSMATGSFPGVKRPGRGVDHLTPYRAEVKERVELYLYSTSGSSWPVLYFTYFTGTSFYCQDSI